MPLSRPLDRPVPSRADLALRFEILPYPARYEELLALRLGALEATEQIRPGYRPSDLRDPRDRNATLVVAEESGRLVAAARLTPPQPGPPLHHDNRMLGPVVGLPPAGTYLEYSKGCVHPDHHGHGLFWRLVAHCLFAARDLGCRYLLGGSNPEIFEFWRRCGFERIPTRYSGPTTPGAVYSLMVLDVERVLAGEGISPKLAAALECPEWAPGSPRVARSRIQGTRE